MGSPAISVAVLSEVIAAGHAVACVYSQPPKPAGRGQELRATPVQTFAEAMGLPVRTPRSLKSAEEQAAFAALDLDVAVVVAYGLILPQPVLDAPRLGCLNLHASLLPRWRGAAPIHRAIMAGDTLTGVQVMQMEAGLDTGPVLMSEQAAILRTDTTGDLTERLARLGADLMVRALGGLERGGLTPHPQATEGVTYAHKVTAEEARIDWTRPAASVDTHIRGLSPAPGAWFQLDTPKGPVRVKALMSRLTEATTDAAPGTLIGPELQVACGDGRVVQLTAVQREGKAQQPASAFVAGNPASPGVVLL
jgi:methionyl-tRNA formyltransferase